jgi:hypothetical protein
VPTFTDRATRIASDLADQARRGVEFGQARLDLSRQRRELDALARQLGWTVHRGRVSGSLDQAEVTRLSGLISAGEAALAAATAKADAQRPPWAR